MAPLWRPPLCGLMVAVLLATAAPAVPARDLAGAALIQADAVLAPPPGGPARRLLGAPAPARTLTSPSNCADWPEPRMYLEGQAWFTRPGASIDLDSSHLHVGACMPHRQRIKGALTLHILVMKHELPDGTTESARVNLQVEFKITLANKRTAKYTVTSKALNAKTTRWDCNEALRLCKQVAVVTIPTLGSRVFVPDGPGSLTLLATVGGFNDGKGRRNLQARITSFLAVDNKGATPWPLPQPLGIDMLANTGFPWGYTHAHVMSDLPMAPLTSTWTFDTRHFIAGAAAKTSNVTGVFISVDPNFHNPDDPLMRGRVILLDTTDADARANCPVKKGHVDCRFPATSLDTAELEDGAHKLFIRTDSFVDPNSSILLKGRGVRRSATVNGGTFSAITLYVFKVCNNPDGCAADATSPPDEQGPPPVIAPLNPPAGAAFYDGSQPLPPQAQVAETPYDCSGWLGSRRYIESQAWHTADGRDVALDSSQLHVGACLPHREMVAGQFPVDILLTKSQFPTNAAAAVAMRVAFFWKGGNVSFELIQRGSAGGWDCANGAVGCRSVYRTMVDTRPADLEYMIPDGLNRVEISASVTFSDGVSARPLMARLTTYLFVVNTGPTDLLASKALPPSTLTRTHFPWKDGAAGLTTDLPLTPVAGALKATLKLTLNSKTGANVTGIYASLDPAFLSRPSPYAGVPLVAASSASSLAAGPLPFNLPAGGLATGKCTKANGDLGSMLCAVSLDPAAVPRDCLLNPCAGGLCDGEHRLFVRVDSYVAQGDPIFADLPPAGQVGAGTLSTVVVLPFTSANGIARDAACDAAATVATASAAAGGGEGAKDGNAGAGLPPSVATAVAHALGGGAGGLVNAAGASARADLAGLGGDAARLVSARAKLVAGAAPEDADDDAERSLDFE